MFAAEGTDGFAQRELILSEPEVHRVGGRPHVVNI
jgi:hypothetical protein